MTATAELALAEAAMDDKEYEVVNGVKEAKMAGARHGGVTARLMVEIGIYLKTNKLGAIYTPIFSGFGAHAVAQRLADCDARLLITADGFWRRGSAVPMKETADEAAAQVPSLEHLLVYRRTGLNPFVLPGGDDAYAYVGRAFKLVMLACTAVVLVLAGVGLYGTLAYLASQRTQEFGVRLALGASAASILRLVMREGGLLTGVGAALGLAGAVAVTRALRGLLYGVTPLDGLTIASVVALVAGVTLVAVGGPAWRAACVNPVTALRAE